MNVWCLGFREVRVWGLGKKGFRASVFEVLLSIPHPFYQLFPQKRPYIFEGDMFDIRGVGCR